MPPALENKGLTAYNEFIAFDGRIISLDFPSFRGGFDSHCPLHKKLQGAVTDAKAFAAAPFY